ncbi:MAG: GatB/YqeY domain-containing protein [bacterium]|nr:GatB/YqeY domain-containing protein [bacterium]MDT8395121.1 GatB/YqeY domain-containing protein [bacterium]
MKLIDRINEDLKRSMKAKDGTRVSVLRFLLASIKNREIEKKGALEEEAVLAEVASSAKRRRESIEAFREGERPDLVDKESAELAILEEYLPEQISEDEVRRTVLEVVTGIGARSPADLGKVMKELMPKLQGRADGKLVSRIVREILSD